MSCIATILRPAIYSECVKIAPLGATNSLQSKLFLNLLNQPRSYFFAAVIRENCCLAIKSYSEVATFGWFEFCALVFKPLSELAVFHRPPAIVKRSHDTTYVLSNATTKCNKCVVFICGEAR